nr:hypothetical protein [Bacteroidota bacterium]
MKTKALQILAALLILTVSSFANPFADGDETKENNTYMTFTVKGEHIVQIRLIKPEDTRITLKVYDETHKNVFTKRFNKTSNLLLSHNISVFPSGVYTYEIMEDGELIAENKIVKSCGKALEYMPKTIFDQTAEAK